MFFSIFVNLRLMIIPFPSALNAYAIKCGVYSKIASLSKKHLFASVMRNVRSKDLDQFSSFLSGQDFLWADPSPHTCYDFSRMIIFSNFFPDFPSIWTVILSANWCFSTNRCFSNYRPSILGTINESVSPSSEFFTPPWKQESLLEKFSQKVPCLKQKIPMYFSFFLLCKHEFLPISS